MVEPMRISQDEFEKLAITFKVADVLPPRSALFAVASLLADHTLAESIGELFTDAQDRTVWVLTGITDASLIRVRASSSREGWSWSEPGSEDQQRGERMEEATRRPLSDLRSLDVARVGDDTSGYEDGGVEWDTEWIVRLRDDRNIRLPSPDAVPNLADRERVESLIAALRQHV